MLDSSGYEAAEGAGAETTSATEVVITPEQRDLRYTAPGQRGSVLAAEQEIACSSAQGFEIATCSLRLNTEGHS